MGIDLRDIELYPNLVFGVETAGLWAMTRVDFGGLLGELGFTGPQRTAALGSIIGRMAAPGSELSTYAWLSERSGLGDLLGVDFEAMNLSALYRVSDRLLASKAALEEALFGRVQDLFGFTTRITLHDLTNTYCEGDMATSPKAWRGHSKEKRSDCPLVTLGLVLGGSGFVRRSEVFSGNISEGQTLSGILAGLNGPAVALVVMDCRIATQANLVWLREQGYRYLVVSRERSWPFDPEQATLLINASVERLHLEKTFSEAGVCQRR